MTTDVFAALLVFAFVASMTPGPNNLMLLASGVNFGFRRTVPHMVGVGVGFFVLVIAVGFGLGALMERFPTLHVALKVIGGVYLLYLAWRLAGARTMGKAEAKTRPMTFLEAAAFQWVNPKGWIMAVAAMATYTVPQDYMWTVLVIGGAFLAMTFLSVSTWAGAGAALSTWLADPVRLRVFNIAMALLLVASLWPMLR